MSLRDQGGHGVESRLKVDTEKRRVFRLIDNRKDFDVMSNLHHGRGGILDLMTSS